MTKLYKIIFEEDVMDEVPAADIVSAAEIGHRAASEDDSKKQVIAVLFLRDNVNEEDADDREPLPFISG